MRISLVHGICMRYDAISNAIADHMLWLRGAGHEVRLYAYACDRPELQCRLVTTLSDVAYDAHFQHSDLVIFHFGITYPLFDLLPVAPRGALRLTAFHNITPKQFVAESGHAGIERSFRQMANISFAHHVLCDSDTNLAVLRAAGIATTATVLPLAVSVPPRPPGSKPSSQDGIVRIVFIGRLVASKGPLDLLAAVREVAERMGERSPHTRVVLDVVAGMAFSDPAHVEAIRAAATGWQRAFGSRLALRLHGDASEEAKQAILADADLFVLPTRHEGFCVPIVEALAHGCKVIAYANSNTPAISGGHASLVPTGDTATLAAALAANIGRITSPAWRDSGYAEHAQRTWRYAQRFAPDTMREAFLDVVAQLSA